jgi:Mce-associated membrane protein
MRPPRLRPPSRNVLSVSAAAALIAACLAASGYIVWQHRTLAQNQQRSQEFAAAARQAIVTLMSIDPDHAKDNFQHMIDDTTGQLKSQLEVTAISLVKDAQDAKVITKATVEEVAVQSMTDNSAVVLVAATSSTTNPDNTTRPPSPWRLSVNIERENGQLKMSKIAFLQ